MIYAMHPPYKAVGARISFAFWTPVLFLAIVMSGLTLLVAATVSVADSRSHHRVRLHRRRHSDLAARGPEISRCGSARLRSSRRCCGSDRRQLGAARAESVSSQPCRSGRAEPLHILVIGARPRQRIPFSGIGCGFSDLRIDRPPFRPRGRVVPVAAVFSWFGLMHSAIMRWAAQPDYAAGWLAAAAIVYSARWWRGDVPRGSPREL